MSGDCPECGGSLLWAGMSWQPLRSRHARHGHTPWCNCREKWDKLILALRRFQEKHGPLSRRLRK